MGARTELLGRRLAGTLALYRIRKVNILTTKPTDPDGQRQIAGNEATSKGVEASVTGRVLPGLNLIANYAYNEARITENGNPDQPYGSHWFEKQLTTPATCGPCTRCRKASLKAWALGVAPTTSVDQPDHTWTLAYFDPYTAQYLGQRNAREHLFGWLLGLHYSLLAGKGGELTVALVGTALLLSVLTGAVVYRKHLLPVLLLRQRSNWKNWRTASSGLHRVVGVWSLLFNLMMAGSGFRMLRYAFLPETYVEQPPAPPATQPAVAVSLDTLARRAAQAVPGFELQGLALPRTPADTVVQAMSRLQDRPLFDDFSQTLEFPARTGRLLSAADVRRASGGEQAERVALTLHFGQFGGWVVKVLWTLGGLSPALLSLSGFLLWRRRHKPRAAAKTGPKDRRKAAV